MELEELYGAYFKTVYRFALGLTGNTHLAEEITSETFFKAIEGAERFRGDCEVRVWLCQIAKNTYFSHLKKSRKSLRLEDTALESLPDPAAPLDTRLSEGEEAAQIRRILHTLPQPYQEVFMWRVLGELSFREIGGLFEKTDNWACVTYHRARKMIQQRLEEWAHE